MMRRIIGAVVRVAASVMATPALAAISADNPALSQEHDASGVAVVSAHDQLPPRPA